MHSWSINASGTVTDTLSVTSSSLIIRHNNLALLQQYGNNAWRVHNYLLEADTKKAESLLEELKEQTTSLNRERKNTQVLVLWDIQHTRC
jgi:hypothetical protein